MATCTSLSDNLPISKGVNTEKEEFFFLKVLGDEIITFMSRIQIAMHFHGCGSMHDLTSPSRILELQYFPGVM